jgi:hypothetical protein
MTPGTTEWAGARSEIFSAGIYVFHRGGAPWMVLAVQAVATAGVVWLVIRTMVPRGKEAVYVGVMAVLCGTSGVAWFVSQPMADAWGPIAYLAAFLLAYGWETLRGWERVLLMLLCAFGVVAHASHLLVMAILLTELAVLCLLRWKDGGSAPRRRGVAAVAVAVALAVAGQMAWQARLHGRVSLLGKHYPFMMARVIYDGPGRTYLEANCGHLQWVICRSVQQLPPDWASFMFGPDSPWERASNWERDRLREEEMPLVLGTLRAYPREQFVRTWRNVKFEAGYFGLYDLNDNEYDRSHASAIEGGATAYGRTRQRQNRLHLGFFGRLLRTCFLISLGMMASLLWYSWRAPLLRGLAGVVMTVLVANACVTGALSTADQRLQTRVVWLATLVGALMIVRLWQGEEAKASAAGEISGAGYAGQRP